jgi:hemerythrin-like domain-containing protein
MSFNPIVAWHEEHVYFGQLLGLLRRELDVVHSGGRPNYPLVQDVISYLREYADEFHHPREDEAFARLARSCPDLNLTLARLQQEHRVIADAGEKLVELIDTVLADEVVPRSALETALATYLVYYGNHIAKEEEDVLARAAKALTPVDWVAVKAAAPAGSDPVFGRKPEERYRELRRQIALEA